MAINYIDDNGVRQIFSDIKSNLDSINNTAVLAYDKANSAYTTATSAYTRANQAYAQANSARDTAKSAYSTANSAYATANSAYTKANKAYDRAISAYSTANLAYNKANNAYNLASKGSITSGTQTFTISGNKTFNITNGFFIVNVREDNYNYSQLEISSTGINLKSYSGSGMLKHNSYISITSTGIEMKSDKTSGFINVYNCT